MIYFEGKSFDDLLIMIGDDGYDNDETWDFHLKYKVHKLSSVGKYTEQVVDQRSRDEVMTNAKMIIKIMMMMMRVII